MYSHQSLTDLYLKDAFLKYSNKALKFVPYSQQLLQRPLLEGLVGAVHDVGLKVVGGVVLHYVADVPDHHVVLVTPFKVVEKPVENRTHA